MPDWKKQISKQLADLNPPSTRETEIVEEVAQHLEDRYRELLAGGATEIEAYRTTIREISKEKLLAKRLGEGLLGEIIGRGLAASLSIPESLSH
jgi:hypothetical protein